MKYVPSALIEVLAGTVRGWPPGLLLLLCQPALPQCTSSELEISENLMQAPALQREHHPRVWEEVHGCR